jgi:hypothetical protein
VVDTIGCPVGEEVEDENVGDSVVEDSVVINVGFPVGEIGELVGLVVTGGSVVAISVGV